MPWAPPLVVQIAMAAAGMIGGGLWILLAGGLRQYRGVNETISSLLLVYIALAILNHLVEGRDARSRKPQQALDARDRRRQHDRLYPRHRCALGPGVRPDRRRRRLHPDLSHHVRLRRARRRRQHSRRQDRRPCGRQADPDHLLPRRQLRAALPAWWKSRPCRAAPTPISPPVTASPASSWLSLPGKIRLRSSPSRFCLAASARGGLLQRRLGLPDASVLVLQGIIFVFVLASDAMYGRIGFLKGKS